MSTRFAVAALVYTMVNAVLFGSGLIVVLTVPALSAHASALIPTVVVVSLVAAMPVSWLLAPRLRARYWRRRNAADALQRRASIAPLSDQSIGQSPIIP